MILRVKYPSDFSVSLTVDEKHIKKTHSSSDGRFTIDDYNMEKTSDFLLFSQYKKTPYKYILFKNGWFNYLFSCFVSFDYTIPKSLFSFECKTRDTSNLIIVLDYKYYNNYLNGDFKQLDIMSIDNKKCTIKKAYRRPIIKKNIKRLFLAYLFAIIINQILYFMMPLIYSLTLIFYPFLIRGESYIDYLLIGFLFLVSFINTIRYCIALKDIYSLLHNI